MDEWFDTLFFPKRGHLAYEQQVLEYLKDIRRWIVIIAILVTILPWLT